MCTTILLLFLQAVIEFPSVALGDELALLLKIFVHSVRVGKPFLKLKTLLILKKIKKKIKFRALEAYVFWQHNSDDTGGIHATFFNIHL